MITSVSGGSTFMTQIDLLYIVVLANKQKAPLFLGALFVYRGLKLSR